VHILPASSNTLHGNRWPVCMVSNECHYRTLCLDRVWAWLTSARITMNGFVQPRLISSLVVKEGSLRNAQYLPASLLTNCLFEHGDQWGALPIFVEPSPSLWNLPMRSTPNSFLSSNVLLQYFSRICATFAQGMHSQHYKSQQLCNATTLTQSSSVLRTLFGGRLGPSCSTLLTGV
jgi:hypothetical protein